MKRTQKVFAILLTLCLLIGALVTTVAAFNDSAVESAIATQLSPAGATRYIGNKGGSSNALDNGTYKANYIDIKGNSVDNFYGSGQTSNNLATSFLNVGIGNTTSAKTGTMSMIVEDKIQQDYLVYDFDFGTDKYSVQVGYKLQTVYTVGDEVTNADGSKSTTTTYEYTIIPSYKTYLPEELTEEKVKADIEAAYAEIVDLQINSDHGSELVVAKVSTTANGKTTETTQVAPIYSLGLKIWENDPAGTKMTYEAAMATKSLALNSGDYVYLMARTWATQGAKVGSSTSYIYYKKDTNGDWYFASAKNGAKVADMSDEPGRYDHITIVVKANSDKTMSYYTFINGEFAFTSTTSAYYSAGFECIRYVIDGAKKMYGSYSLNVANSAVNYYAAGYTSGDAYGIDDYITSGDYATKSLTACTDIVYTANYVSPNGYLFVNNGYDMGDFASTPARVAEEIAKLKNGGTIVTTMDVNNITVPSGVEGFTISCDNKLVNATLSEKSISDGYVITKTADGYSVSLDVSDRVVYVKWLDIKGGHLTTTRLFYGEAPDSSRIVANVYDENTGTIYYADLSGWSWSLDGDVRAVTSDMIAAGSTITMTPVVSGSISSQTGATFYMGVRYDDTLVTAPVPASNGTFSYYNNRSAVNMISESVAASRNGDTCVLLTDFTGDDGDMAAYPSSDTVRDIPAGQTLNLDLNGHVLVRTGWQNKSFGSPLYAMKENSTLNVYSLKEGGMIVMGNMRASGYTNGVTSSGGIARVDTGIDKALVNIGDILDVDGNVISKCGDNFTYIGGTMVYVNGAKKSESYDGSSLRNGKKITININHGFYYSPWRTSYAFISTLAPDTVLNADGITFVSAYSSGAFFHDYDPSQYANNSTVTVTNSKLYSMLTKKVDGKIYADSAVNIINILATDSVAYFEGCTIAGNLCNTLYGKITIGKNNYIAQFGKFDIFTSANVIIKEGVNYASPSDYNITANITHPYATKTWDENMDMTYPSDAAITGIVDTDAEAALLTSAVLKSRVWNETFTIILDKPATIVTYDFENLPEFIAPVIWQSAGGEVLATTYEMVGTTPEVPKEAASTVGEKLNKAWYVTEFQWGGSSGRVVKAGENVFTPTAIYTPKIRGTKVNVSLFEDVSYNFYLPVTGDVSDVSVSGAILSDKTYTLNGVEYLVVSAKLPVDSFAVTEATVSYKAEDGTPLSYTLKLDLMSYATIVAERYECGSEEAILVYEMVAYKEAVAKYVNSSFSETEALSEFKLAHDNCACGATSTEMSDAELAADYSALKSNGITGVAYSLSLGEIGMVILVDNGAIVDCVTYTDDFGREISHTVAKGNLISKNGYYLVININAAYIDNVMTISSGDKSGTYSLATYIQNNPGVEIAKTLYKYSTAAENYKYVRESEDDTKTFTKMQSVLLMGQSNMTSSNNLYEADLIEDDRLFMMRNYGWVKMEEPIHTGSPLYGAGIGATFGKAFVETFDCNLGLIPAARGGTTLADWAVGGDLYNNAVKMAKAAQETSEICAILWHQGEGDQNNRNYAALLQVIFDSLIEELGLDPDKIVIITGELFGTRSDEVHMPQLIELGKHYKNYGIALSDGLTVRDVTTHFDAPSMRVFGYRYFDIFYNLLTGKRYYFDQNPEHYVRTD